MSLSELLADGSLGFLWEVEEGTAPSLDGEPRRGYVRCDGGWASVESLEEDVMGSWLADHDGPRLDGIVIVLSAFSGLLLEVQEAGFSRVMGPRASVRRHRARTVVSKVPFERLRSTRVHALEARFFGISTWAGVSALKETFETDGQGLGKAWSVRLESPPSSTARLAGARSLLVSADWRTDGPADQRVVSTPIGVRCESRTARPVWDLLEPLLRVQDLVSVLHGGFVVASSGTAAMDLRRAEEGRPDETPELWNGALMVSDPSAPTPPKHEYPLTSLSTLGGVAGLARWVKFCGDHRRAIRPAITPYRSGPVATEAALLETSAAIEYWVNANKGRAWASKQRGAHAVALARHAGPAFSEWVGNPVRWGEALRAANNSFKHDPKFIEDPQRLSDLAVSARMLLVASALDRAARSHAPSREIFQAPRLHGLGLRLQGEYA